MDRFVRLKDGALMPKLGQGTWFLGEDKSKEQDEIKSIKIGSKNKIATKKPIIIFRYLKNLFSPVMFLPPLS